MQAQEIATAERRRPRFVGTDTVLECDCGREIRASGLDTPPRLAVRRPQQQTHSPRENSERSYRYSSGLSGQGGGRSAPSGHGACLPPSHGANDMFIKSEYFWERPP